MSTFIAAITFPTVLIESPHFSAMKEFLARFYEESDIKAPADPHIDTYPLFFHPDATLKMGSATAQGTEQIAQLRQGMWKAVTKRHHKVLNVGLVSPTRYMVNGTVAYTLTNDKELVSEWAAVIDFGDVALVGKTMRFYQVYLDPTPMKEALA